MTERRRLWLKRLLFLPPVLLGVAVVVFELSTRDPPRLAEPAEVAKPVRVIPVEPVDFVPRALGYGYVQPGKVWEAVAEVSGKIVYRHPELERGRLLPQATEILRIDTADYELAVRRLEASKASDEAKLAEIDVRKANIESSLSIEHRALDLARQDLTRKRALFSKGNVSQSAVDQAEVDVLAQRQKVQELENDLALIPVERRVLEAELELAVAQLHEARLDLERTSIRLPFEGRVADVSVEETEFVNVGQTIATIDSIDVAEVTAQVALDRMPPLIPAGVDISNMSAEDLSTFPRRWGLTSEARLASGDFAAAWPARFDRISDEIDPQTRTIGIIVAVDEPYRLAIPGQRPPLTKNMYVEVEIRGPVQPGQVVVPRVAVHRQPGGPARVYLAGPDDRLLSRAVDLGPEQGDLVVIRSGLAPGERLVISDLIPAIEGMLLIPVDDPDAAEWLRAQAEARSVLR